MSSVIAVCVSFIGLASVIAVFVVFIQMILSFPAMLSSNSQTYIQQRRQHHHIPSPDPIYLATSSSPYAEGAEEADTEETENETEPEWGPADDAVDRWIEDVDEQTGDRCSSQANHVSMYKTACLSRGIEQPVTRGRPLRRQPRKHTSRAAAALCLRDDVDSRSRTPADGRRSACAPSWRNVEWTR